MAVNKFTNGSGGNTWNTAGNWSLGVVPTSSDGHVTTFDATSPNCTMGAARSCNHIDFTGYTNTLTMSTNTLTVAGNVTLDTGMGISGTGGLTISAASTITSNGKTWPNNLTLNGQSTYTLSGDLAVSGLLTLSGRNQIINKTLSEKITASGGITLSNGNSHDVTGSAKIIITGGTWFQNAQSTLSLDIDIQGDITISNSSEIRYHTGTLRYVSGSITVTGVTLLIQGGSTTIDTSSLIWPTVTINTAGSTLTLNSTLNCVTLNNSGSSAIAFAGAYGFVASIFVLSAITSQSITLQESVTYTITSALTANTSRVGAVLLFTSSHATNKAMLTLREGATCAVLADFTRIDASGGRPIRAFNSTVTDCINVQSFFDLKSVAS